MLELAENSPDDSWRPTELSLAPWGTLRATCSEHLVGECVSTLSELARHSRGGGQRRNSPHSKPSHRIRLPERAPPVAPRNEANAARHDPPRLPRLVVPELVAHTDGHRARPPAPTSEPPTAGAQALTPPAICLRREPVRPARLSRLPTPRTTSADVGGRGGLEPQLFQGFAQRSREAHANGLLTSTLSCNSRWRWPPLPDAARPTHRLHALRQPQQDSGFWSATIPAIWEARQRMRLARDAANVVSSRLSHPIPTRSLELECAEM